MNFNILRPEMEIAIRTVKSLYQKLDQRNWWNIDFEREQYYGASRVCLHKKSLAMEEIRAGNKAIYISAGNSLKFFCAPIDEKLLKLHDSESELPDASQLSLRNGISISSLEIKIEDNTLIVSEGGKNRLVYGPIDKKHMYLP